MIARPFRSLALVFAAIGAVLLDAAPKAHAIDAITLVPVHTGLARPVALTHAGDGSNRIFIVQQGGQILVSSGSGAPTTFLDIDPLVRCCDEEGLLSVAFHPGFGEGDNHYFYVNYTNNNGDSVIARYTANAPPNENTADPNSALILKTIPHPGASNHNGGQLQFGPDGFLYLGMGDGGGAGDPNNNGQSINTLLGKMLRLDVDATPPYIAAGNPYEGATPGLDEIWSIGLRNPWRFSFDRWTGDLFVADVGQGDWEEVNVIAAGTPAPLNYGWRIMEGTHCYPPGTPSCDTTGLVLPPIEYDHTNGDCAVAGGYRYRGSVYPEMVGQYLYGDYCTGRIWSAVPSGGGTWASSLILDAPLFISAFGEDETGELYVLHHGETTGAVYRIDASLMADGDDDGCADVEETGADPADGGARDPLSPWDFFDVPSPAGPATGADGKLILTSNSVRNEAVSLQDVGTVLAYVGRSSANPAYGQDNNGDGIGDGTQLDRTPSTDPGELWRSGPPNNAVSLQDVGVALAQVGHSCAPPP
jgi:glucose/arabinose dehydrogenase